MNNSEQIERFRRYLPYLRMTAGYSQQGMADVLEISRGAYCRIENGKGPMSRRDYYALRYILGVSPSKNLTDALVDSITMEDNERSELVKRFDEVIKNTGRKNGVIKISDRLIMTYNKFLLERFYDNFYKK